MTPRIRLLLFVAGLSLVAASCSAGTVAATVDGSEISYDEVSGISAEEPGATFGGELFRNILFSFVAQRASMAAAEEQFGLVGFDTPEVREAWLLEASESDLSIVESIASNPAYTTAGTDFVVTSLALRDAIAAELAADPDLQQAVWDQAGDTLVEVCASHILTETEEEVAEAAARVAAGEDFAAVATEVSLDTASPGGELTCPSSPSSFVEPFDSVVSTQPIGEVSEPFETQFGWHIVLVDSRDQATGVEDIAADPDRWMPQSVIEAAYTDWASVVIRESEIHIASQVGTWFPQGDGIIPPPSSP